MENLTLDASTRSVVDRMEHVHMAVADIDRSLAFYQALLGFETRYDQTAPDGSRCVHIGTDRFYIALSERPGLKPSRPASFATIFHVGFSSGLSLDQFRARLGEAGLEHLAVSERKEGWAVYLTDPDGHEVEVVGYGANYAYW